MSENKLLNFRLIGAVSVAAVSASLASQGVTVANDDVDFTLEEIVVTASRREQSIQDVPAAVTAIAPDSFKVRGLQTVKEALDYTPGIYFTDGGNPGRGTITARGVPQSSATPVFGVYLDDTPLTTNTNFSGGAGTFLDGLLMDIERVEVIKGPQGTLYGATSVGGMLRYISKDPALEEFRASFGVDTHVVSDGDWGQTYNGRVSVPVIKNKLGITVSGYYRDVAGYVDYVNAGTGDVIEENADRGNVKGYSADVLFMPTDELKVRLKYLKQEAETDLGSSVQLAGVDSDAGLFGDYASVSQPAPQTVDFEVMSGTLEYDFGWGTFTSTSSGTEFSYVSTTDLTAAYAGLVDLLDGRAAGTTTSVLFDASQGAEKFVQEMRLTSNSSEQLEWIAGFYYTKEETFNIQDITVTPAFDFLFANFPSEYEEYAGFGDVTWYFNENFDVTAGVRVSRDKVVLNFVSNGAAIGVTDFESATIKDTVETYLLAARYRVDDNMSLYARVASGYRPPQANLPVIDPITQEDIAPPIVFADKAWSYEVGAKGSFSDNMLSYELAFWKIDWSNFQAAVTANGVTTGGNAADGLSAYGFESMVTLRPTSAFSVTANLGYTKSTLNSDEPGLGGLEGENYPDLPKWKGSLQWNYAFALGGDWTGDFGGGLRYASGYVSAFSQSLTSAPVDVDSYALADLNFSVSNDRLTLGLYATNLFNSRKISSRSDNIIGGGTSSSAVFHQPRTVGVNLSVNF